MGSCWYILWPISLFYGDLKYFMDIFCGNLVYFPRLGMSTQKIWQPCFQMPAVPSAISLNGLNSDYTKMSLVLHE
jgi:hypothetical protein